MTGVAEEMRLRPLTPKVELGDCGGELQPAPEDRHKGETVGCEEGREENVKLIGIGGRPAQTEDRHPEGTKGPHE